MSYKELQQQLKTLRTKGYQVNCKLNAKKEILQAEYDRLTANNKPNLDFAVPADEAPKTIKASPKPLKNERCTHYVYRLITGITWTGKTDIEDLMHLRTLIDKAGYDTKLVYAYCSRAAMPSRSFSTVYRELANEPGTYLVTLNGHVTLIANGIHYDSHELATNSRKQVKAIVKIG